MARLKLKLQLYCGDEIAMGPGKADLLEAIGRTGSISAAGRALVTDTIGLADTPAVFESLKRRSGQCKVLIAP